MNKQFYVALITPFHKDKTVDYKALKNIMEKLLDEGCDGFIVNGTTAESCVLSEKEKFTILQFVIDYVNGQIPIWFGCGSNDTMETLRLCKKSIQYDITGVLLVTPYYNKPTQNGLFAHFDYIASNVNIAIMLYQVPSRTAVAMSAETIEKLIEKNKNIIALKYADHNYELIDKILMNYPEFIIYSGEDGDYINGFKHGMHGIISVMGHVLLKEMKENNNLSDAAGLLFKESSPSPIKYWLSKEGLCEDVVRLPLVPIEKDLENEIDLWRIRHKNI